MRMPTSSSVFLATLASSASLSALVSAAPTDSGDSGAVAPAPGNDASAAGVPDLSGILGSIPGRRAVDIETRQLGPVVDTLAGVAPVVDTVLGLLGLQRKDAVGTASALPLDMLNQIQSLVSQATAGLPVPLPLPALPVGGAAPTPAAPKAARADASWAHDRQHGQQSSDAEVPPFQLAAALPALPALPVGAPALPAPPAPPAPGNANNGTGGPAPPPAPAAPFSPGLPPNPPNTPIPPLFAGAASVGDGYNCTQPANGTGTMTEAAMETQTGSATASGGFACPTTTST